MVIGDSGSGKSALMCNWSARYRDRFVVIVGCVGCDLLVVFGVIVCVRGCCFWLRVYVGVVCWC